MTCPPSHRARLRLPLHGGVLLLLISLVACDATAPDSLGYGLSGVVTNAVTQRPVAVATVAAPQRGVTSGSDGRYNLADLSKGRVRIRVTHPDYVDDEREIDVDRLFTPGDFGLVPK